MMHVYGDPLKYRDLESKIAVEKFNSAIILCDAAWVDPDQVHHQGCCIGMTVLVRALFYIAVARMPQSLLWSKRKMRTVASDMLVFQS